MSRCCRACRMNSGKTWVPSSVYARRAHVAEQQIIGLYKSYMGALQALSICYIPTWTRWEGLGFEVRFLGASAED